MKIIKTTLAFPLCFVLLLLFGCGGGGGGDGEGRTTLSDTVFIGGAFANPDDSALSLVSFFSFIEFSGATVDCEGLDTENQVLGNVEREFTDAYFDDNRLAILYEISTDEDVPAARSANDEYFIFGYDHEDRGMIGLGVNVEDFPLDFETTFSGGMFSVLRLVDDHRNDGSNVYSEIIDNVFAADGTGTNFDFLSFGFDDGSGFVDGLDSSTNYWGQFSKDANVLVISDADDQLDDFVSLSIAIRQSSGKNLGTLNGYYNFIRVEANNNNINSLESFYGEIYFNGSGTCRIETFSTSVSTDDCIYAVNASTGEVSINLNGTQVVDGIISEDNELIALVTAPGPYMIIATKQ